MAGPIQRVVIVVKENHGFDTYFGRFPGADGDATLAQAASPPDRDPTHTHEAWLQRATHAVREQYGEADIPTYWEWAKQYTLCDRYFTDVAGPSTPNHLMLIAADSPWIDNPHGGYRAGPQQQVDLPSLPAQLEAAGLTWGNYGGYAFDFVKALAGKQRASSQFVADAQAGTLPTVSWVYADHAHSEHAPDTPADHAAGVGNVAAGMAWTAAQIDAVVAGGLWDTTAIFVTWDDWGGWADHVDPPEVETWSDGTQFRYGNRVPCLVLGAHAKAAHVSHVQRSHVSLLRFCEQTFGLPPLNARTAAADDMGDCFDYSKKLPPPGAAPAPTPTPQPSPQSALTQIHDAAARASARVAAAAAAAKEPAVLQQLRYAARDLERITKLSS
ncbi:MAG TPA: alkaline phosphatase family protein [Gaiellaceae bacterium]|nr:alkaline phosphatase family protein [Gaiellaceae bacterium]